MTRRPPTRRPSPEALREAARVAREEGVTVRLERDGWVCQIGPHSFYARRKMQMILGDHAND